MKKTGTSAPGSVRYYLNHIAQYEREFKTWEGRVEKILKVYKDDERRETEGEGARFNILWSNVQTLKASTFTNMPKPDVSRRFKDNDPVGRVASLIIERALEFETQHYNDFRQTLRQSVYDRFLGGRGIAWVRYEPIFSGETANDEDQITEDVESETLASEQLDFECAPTDYVHWKDFGHQVARTWEEVGIVWRKVYMGREAMIERFPEFGKKIPLDASPQESSSKTDPDSTYSRGLIYEIWDKETGKAYWLSKSLNKFVDVKDDPLELEGFFPCPRPLFATLTNDSLVPLPDYTLYQDQATQLNVLSDRIEGLVRALKVFGVYDSSIPELARLFKEGGNTDLLPVKNWAAFAEKNGLKGAIDIVEIAPIAQALNDAYAAFEMVKKQIYELTGIADIQRGSTMASETATAQNIKNQYATLRLKVYQDEVATYATNLLRMKAEIICKHFDPQTIMKMAGADQLSDADKQVLPQAMMLLKDAPMRNFRIDIEADSMILIDEMQEKQDRVEFLQATSQFIEKVVQAGQTAPQIVPIGIELLKFGVRGFKIGKTIEGTIDEFAEKMVQQASQPQQQQPDPEAIKAEAAQQTQAMQQQHEQQLAQAEQQNDAMRMQHEQQLEQFKAQTKMQQDEAARQHEAMLEQSRQQHEAMLEQMRQQAQRESDNANAQLQIMLARIKANTGVEVAEIGAQTTLDAAQISAAQQGTEE